MNPVAIQITRLRPSRNVPILNNFPFLMDIPNTPAKIGPIMGETSILATRMTLEF